MKGLKNLKKEGREEEPEAESPVPPGRASAEPSPQDRASWQPKTLFHTRVSSLASSEEFGPMMAAEATPAASLRRRRKRSSATVRRATGRSNGDGFTPLSPLRISFMPWNTSIPPRRRSTPMRRSLASILGVAAACWKGDVAKVVADLRVWQSRLGILPVGEKVPDTDPRKIIHSVTTYFTNCGDRLDYLRYRQEGLPVTSSLAESLVKQISKRVKGTESSERRALGGSDSPTAGRGDL